MKIHSFDELQKIDLFSDLSNLELEKLSEISHFKTYGKDEILFYQGDSPNYLNIITKGTLKLYKTTPKGKEIFLHTIRPVSMVAELVNFEGIKYPASAVFLQNGEVLRIDYDKFSKEFLQNPKICLMLLKSVTKKLLILNSVLEQEVTLGSEAKIAKFIVCNFELFTKLKNIQIAQILNLTPETLSRVISKFKSNGFINLDQNGDIIDFDENLLRDLFEN